MKVAFVILLAALLSACSGPNTDQVRADFQARHPGCTVSSSVSAEGDFEWVWIEIRYTCPGNAATQVEEVLYQDTDGRWTYKPT